MPNIKIYGLSPQEEAAKFKQIQDIFKNESYSDDIVVSLIKSEVIDLKGRSQPYVQLELSCMKNYNKKLKLLKKLGMDIQVVHLHDFIPKKK